MSVCPRVIIISVFHKRGTTNYVVVYRIVGQAINLYSEFHYSWSDKSSKFIPVNIDRLYKYLYSIVHIAIGRMSCVGWLDVCAHVNRYHAFNLSTMCFHYQQYYLSLPFRLIESITTLCICWAAGMLFDRNAFSSCSFFVLLLFNVRSAFCFDGLDFVMQLEWCAKRCKKFTSKKFGKDKATARQ